MENFSKHFPFLVQLHSIEQFQHMHAALQQQLLGGTRGSVSSQEGGRLFNDAIAWISQQKVSFFITTT